MGPFSPKTVLLYVTLVCLGLGVFCYAISSQFSSPTYPQASAGILEAPAQPMAIQNTPFTPEGEKALVTGGERMAAMVADDCQVSARYPTKIYQWCGLISRYAAQHQLEPNLVAALILVESGGDAQAISRNGAVGLMQIMPRDGLAAEFQCPNGPCFANRPTIKELKNPEYNLNYGTKMLARLVNKRGDLREALFAYGPAGVGYTYADKVLGTYEAYK